MTTAHSETSEAVVPHGIGMAPKIEWFEGSREELSDLFALADDSAAAVSTYRALGRVLAASDGSTVIGHLQLVVGDSEDEAEVKSLAVREDRQGAGVGRLLVEHAATACREAHRSTLLVATAAADTRVLRFHRGARRDERAGDQTRGRRAADPRTCSVPSDDAWGRVGMKAGALAMRLARVSEREALEQLQRRSSMHEPMYRAQLAAHPDAIELAAEQIAEGLVRVAEQNGAIVGFAVLLERSADACELDGLFVEPERMRAGVGRRLVEDAKRIACERGATRIDVVANPQAVAFYEAVGFTTVGDARTRFGRAPRMSLPVVG